MERAESTPPGGSERGQLDRELPMRFIDIQLCSPHVALSIKYLQARDMM